MRGELHISVLQVSALAALSLTVMEGPAAHARSVPAVDPPQLEAIKERPKTKLQEAVLSINEAKVVIDRSFAKVHLDLAKRVVVCKNVEQRVDRCMLRRKGKKERACLLHRSNLSHCRKMAVEVLTRGIMNMSPVVEDARRGVQLRIASLLGDRDEYRALLLKGHPILRGLCLAYDNLAKLHSAMHRVVRGSFYYHFRPVTDIFPAAPLEEIRRRIKHLKDMVKVLNELILQVTLKAPPGDELSPLSYPESR